MKLSWVITCRYAILLAGFLCILGVPLHAQSGSASIFKANCAECHSMDGSADTAMGRSLKMRDLRFPEVQKRTDAELTDIITNGMGTMHPYKDKLTKDQIQQMVAYIRQIAKK